MKKVWIFFIAFLFFSLSNSSKGQTVTKEELVNMLEMCDSPDALGHASTVALANLDLVEEVIFIPKQRFDNFFARTNGVSFLHIVSVSKRISEVKFFDVVFRLIKEIDDYTFPEHKVEELAEYQKIVKFYGYNPILKKYLPNPPRISILENLGAFLTCLNSMSKYDQIKDIGILNSIKVKISGAKEIMERQGEKGSQAAINKLNAAINEADAQKGKHITEYGSEIIVGYCKTLISQIQDKAF